MFKMCIIYKMHIMYEIHTLYPSSVSSIYLPMYPSICVSPAHTFLSSCQSSASHLQPRPRGAQPRPPPPAEPRSQRLPPGGARGPPRGPARPGPSGPLARFCCVTRLVGTCRRLRFPLSRPGSLEGSFAGVPEAPELPPLAPGCRWCRGPPSVAAGMGRPGVPPGPPRLLGEGRPAHRTPLPRMKDPAPRTRCA